MATLQEPEFVLRNGELISWKEATIHVDSPAAKRSVSVFEGIKGYWQRDNEQFGIVELKKHYERLRRSAKLLYIPCPWTFEDFQEDVFRLIGALLTREKDMWIRPTLFAVEGQWGLNTQSEMIMTAFHQDKAVPRPIKIGVSTWQRSIDAALPCRIKTASNYQVSRLARIEGRSRGYEEMILLNNWGRVAEATGACVLMVRDGQIVTPPPYEGALESITVNIVEQIARDLGIDFVRRPVERTELLIAEELAVCGTLAEVVPVSAIDDMPVDPAGPVLEQVRKRFFDLVRGKAVSQHLEIADLPLTTTTA